MTKTHEEMARSAVPPPSDPTFRNEKFSSLNATAYAAHRPAYPRPLIDTILDLHQSSSGSNGLLIDVGCGPGNSTRLLAPHFQHAIGVDPGQSMIETAQSDKLPPCTTMSGEPTRFKVCAAEELSSIVEPESVDMITAATAAHWFDMPRFYVAASKVLKPGGSLAIWCGSRYYVDPSTTPNAKEVQKVWDTLEFDVLAPYMMPGNLLGNNLYRDLATPWSIRTEDTKMAMDAETRYALDQFDETKSKKQYFNADGQPDPRFTDTHGYMWHETVSTARLVHGFGTSSPVMRWREAHKEQLEKGEIMDVAEEYLGKKTSEALGGSTNEFGVGISVALIWIKKKA